MGRAAHWPDVWRVVLGSIILLAWWLLARDSAGSMVPAFCSSETLWPLPLSARLDLALMLVSPAQLALDSALMIAAMMLPLIIAPLRHVRDRSFARQRARATILFVAGYGVMWMIAAVFSSSLRSPRDGQHLHRCCALPSRSQLQYFGRSRPRNNGA